MIKVKVVGCGGYGGVGIVELLLRHPEAKIQTLVAATETGMAMSDLYPHLKGFCDLPILKPDDPAAQEPADIESSLKARRLLADVEERELRLGIRRGEFVAVEEVRQTWTEFVAQATAMLRKKFEQELPPILSGLDATGIQEEARRAIDEVLAALHEAG